MHWRLEKTRLRRGVLTCRTGTRQKPAKTSIDASEMEVELDAMDTTELQYNPIADLAKNHVVLTIGSIVAVFGLLILWFAHCLNPDGVKSCFGSILSCLCCCCRKRGECEPRTFPTLNDLLFEVDESETGRLNLTLTDSEVEAADTETPQPTTPQQEESKEISVDSFFPNTVNKKEDSPRNELEEPLL